MSIKFFLRAKKWTLPCYPSLNLLGHAQLEELDLGSQCGGHGICGRDRVKIAEGANCLSPPNEVEQKHLSLSQIQSGWRLACQAWPSKEDNRIRVEVGEGGLD